MGITLSPALKSVSKTSNENLSPKSGQYTPYLSPNIAKIANALHCHSLLPGNKDCREFEFSIVRIVKSVSNINSVKFFFCNFHFISFHFLHFIHIQDTKRTCA